MKTFSHTECNFNSADTFTASEPISCYVSMLHLGCFGVSLGGKARALMSSHYESSTPVYTAIIKTHKWSSTFCMWSRSDLLLRICPLWWHNSFFIKKTPNIQTDSTCFYLSRGFRSICFCSTSGYFLAVLSRHHNKQWIWNTWHSSLLPLISTHPRTHELIVTLGRVPLSESQ